MNSSEEIINLIKSIPYGKVAGYGQIAALAGIPHGARLVVRILNASCRKHNLPWWRVVRSNGEIGLPGEGGTQQRAMLKSEGIEAEEGKRIPIKYFWQIGD
jgi:methylated-DNA-protein-cysteine methyltransferase-like protein